MARHTHTIIDCDLHYRFASEAQLEPFLPRRRAHDYFAGGGGVPHPDGAYRLDAAPDGGGPPGSDPAFTARDHLDRHGIEYGILSLDSALGSVTYDLQRSQELASAINDWTLAEWLTADDRFLGSINVSAGDPEAAAAEIRRLGDHPRMVQAYTVSLPCLMGNELLHPIYEACAEVGVPFTLHPSGFRTQPTAAPTTFVEYHTDMAFGVLPHLVSMVIEGVFVKYPSLTLVLNEYGIAWLPFVLWRLDMEYRSGRDEVPWLTKLPSEYIAEHVRLTTQPLEEPADRQDLIKLLSLFDAERMLMFSSDYPHWDADNPAMALRGFPEEFKRRIFAGNAREAFRLPEPLAPAAAA